MNRPCLLIIFAIFLGATLMIEPALASSIIGEFKPSNEINIEQQDYIDKYFTWNFQELNKTHWFAHFSIDSFLWLQAKGCINATIGRVQCFQTLCNNYFSDYFNCSRTTNRNKLINDFSNLANYPLKNLTSNIKFSNLKINLTSGNAEFNIIFPNGFKEKERAEFGFNSTIVNSATSTSPFDVSRRSICKDGAGILHVSYRYNSGTITYANSSNGITWNVNSTIVNSTGAKSPSFISCDGNNITISYEDTTNDDAIIWKSENNGATFSQLTSPVTSSVYQSVAVERRGQRIYVLYIDSSTDRLVRFINSTDGGTTWGSITTIVTPPASSDCSPTSFAVDGTGGADDKIYVIGDCSSDYFVNSTNSGVTWGSQLQISTLPDSLSHITFSGNNLYVIGYDGNFGTNNENFTFVNSTDLGITWNTAYRFPNIINIEGSDALSEDVSLALGNNGNPYFFLIQKENNANGDISYMSYSGTSWSDLQNITNNNLGNRFVTTPYTYYGDNKIHYVWRNGTGSYNIMYDYISLETGGETYEASFNVNSKASLNLLDRIIDFSRTSNINSTSKNDFKRNSFVERNLNIISEESNSFEGILFHLFERMFNIATSGASEYLRNSFIISFFNPKIDATAILSRAIALERIFNAKEKTNNSLSAILYEGLEVFERILNIDSDLTENFLRLITGNRVTNVNIEASNQFNKIILLTKSFNVPSKEKSIFFRNYALEKLFNVRSNESVDFNRNSVATRLLSILESSGVDFTRETLFGFMERIFNIPLGLLENYLIYTSIWKESKPYEVCSILQQIGKSRAYLCVYDTGEWKVLIKGV